MRRYLYMGVFFAGLSSLAVELSASRLLGNYFGSSNLVWAAIIGLILIYLSVGYTLGGKWADRSPQYQTFFSILLWASLCIGLVPLASRPILRFASQAFDELRMAELFGSFTAVLALFSLPVILLGTASPFAVRLAMDDTQKSGSVAGKIYTISTLGSFIGTFLPVLLLIPAIGTYRTFVSLSGLLMAISFIGLWKTVSLKSILKFIWMPLVLVGATFIGLRGLDKSASNVIYESESAYNYIQVQQVNGFNILRLNEGQGIHSIYKPNQENYHGAWEQVLASPFFYNSSLDPVNVKRVAILGLAAGTSANQVASVYPNSKIDGYEIDPKIINVGYTFFNMNKSNLEVFTEDARVGITNNNQTYDIISVDAYRPPYIPWHLTTREFFQQTFDHLSNKGSLVINVVRIFEDRRLVDTLYMTISSVFPSAYVVDIPNTLNSVIYATKMPTNSDNLIANYASLEKADKLPELLRYSLETAILNLRPAPKEGIILTDDRSPVEWITNSMIFNLFSSGNLEALN
jgi:spermidine synthase